MTKKILYLGDPHAQVSNLHEVTRLTDFVLDTAAEKGVAAICIVGDLFHNHAVIRLEVLDFWTRFFKKAAERKIKIIAMAGNHDKPGSTDKDHMTAISVFKYWRTEFVTVVDTPTTISELGIDFMPYFRNESDLLEAMRQAHGKTGNKCVVAHQTFTGAQYENGFYDKDAIDPAEVPYQQVVSGHIHMAQAIDKVLYVGTPKWDTMSDANQHKGFSILEHGKDGLYDPEKSERVSTAGVCTPIKTFVVLEECKDEVPKMDKNDRNHVTLVGSSDWIKKMKKKIGDGARIKVKPTDSLSSKVKDEVALSNIDEFLRSFETLNQVDKKRVIEYIKRLGGAS